MPSQRYSFVLFPYQLIDLRAYVAFVVQSLSSTSLGHGRETVLLRLVCLAEEQLTARQSWIEISLVL